MISDLFGLMDVALMNSNRERKIVASLLAIFDQVKSNV